MADLIEKATGKVWDIDDDQYQEALSSTDAEGNPIYSVPSGETVTVVDDESGVTSDVEAVNLGHYADQGMRGESSGEKFGRFEDARIQDEHGSLGQRVLTGIESGAGAATFGASDWVAGAVLGDDYRTDRRERKQANPGTDLAANIGGSLLPALASGGSGLIGSIARATPAGRVSMLGSHGIKGMMAEGALFGLGEASQQLAVEEDPLTLERAASVIGSNVVYGAGVVGGIGLFGKAAGKGIQKAKRLADDFHGMAAKRAGVADDLRHLDSKGLQVAHKAETDILEQASKAAKEEIADELVEFHRVAQTAKLKTGLNGQLKNLKALRRNPLKARNALEEAEQSLGRMVDDGAQAARASGDAAQIARFDAIEDVLTRNRSLQSKIAKAYEPATSPRLSMIQDAAEVLGAGSAKGPAQGLLRKTAEGAGFGMVASALSPIAGPATPMAAAWVTNKLSDLVFGRLSKSAAEAGLRTSQAVDAFLKVGKATKVAAPPLATKVLSSVAFGPSPAKTAADFAKSTSKKPSLLSSYNARAKEIRSQTMLGNGGKIVMQPHARQQMAQRLSGVKAVSSKAADRIETMAARKLTYMAQKLPKKPDYMAKTIGPQTWMPTEMQMRTFARIVTAVEDPGSVEEALAQGRVTPESAEAYRTVYPERFADIHRQIMGRLPELRASLSYEKRLALSIFTDIPVDPAMQPEILAVLQGQYTDEPGTEGGIQAPKPSPQFGSISRPDPTSAQERAG